MGNGRSNCVVVYGPAACGKTTNRDRLMEHFGARECIDPWEPGMNDQEVRRAARKGRTLVLTTACPEAIMHAFPWARALSFKQAVAS